MKYRMRTSNERTVLEDICINIPAGCLAVSAKPLFRLATKLRKQTGVGKNVFPRLSFHLFYRTLNRNLNIYGHFRTNAPVENMCGHIRPMLVPTGSENQRALHLYCSDQCPEKQTSYIPPFLRPHNRHSGEPGIRTCRFRL